jgi:TPR repeat protein
MDDSFSSPNLLTTRPRYPYPGLRPFEPEEWSIFFGRETMIDEVIDRLANGRLVLIHGASGSGKSSLVRAGVLPRLARQHMRHGTTWLTCAMRPSGGPLWNLAAEFARMEGRGGDQTRIADIIRLFNRRGATLSKVAAALEGLAGKRLCLLVDQFEELFRFERETSRDEAELFIDLLTGEIPNEAESDGSVPPAPNARACELHIIITMRSEFLGECARFDGLAEAINRTQYLVPRLSRPDLVRAIRQPAEFYGGVVTVELADCLIADARGKPDELPLIQHGLMLFWHNALQTQKTGKIVLTVDLLERAGSLAQLLSDHADRVMDAVDPALWLGVARSFRALTDINADGQAIRRPRSFQALVADCGIAEGNLRTILNAFRAEGVSFLTPYFPAPIMNKTVIDISHEALIRCWKAIGDPKEGWLRNEFDDGLMWRSLLLQASEFEEDKKRVLSPATTAERERWLKRQTPAWSDRYGGKWESVAGLLRASRRQIIRSYRRRWLLALPFLAAAAMALPGLINAYIVEVFEDEVNTFNGGIAIIFICLTLLILILMAIDHGSEFVRKFRPPRPASIGEKKPRLFARISGRLMKHMPNFIRHFCSMLRTYWHAPVLVLYLISLGFVFFPWIMKTPYFDVRAGNHAFNRKDYSVAMVWYSKAADLGDAQAEVEIGALYRNGWGVQKNLESALNWYVKAAEQGNATAQYQAGLMCWRGEGTPADPKKAMAWYLKAAAQEYPAAQNDIGVLYNDGDGVPADPKVAMTWYLKASQHGLARARDNIGLLYQDGKGVPADPAEAMKWFRQAADQNLADSQRHVGRLYELGLGVPKDPVLAREWMTKAADGGDDAAKKWLETHDHPP